MALFCDFENVALGVRDAQYDKFDIKRVLERLLLKGSIVVKKAYCDWERYKGFKSTMHEANFELIEIPHVRQSGKNSADIRLVVDALDLCYTKSHVDTFVIISGDSDFSPLVSKLRENAKQVIGVGVKQSTSDLLIANCDEFIFYDDLVRESQRASSRRDTRESHAPAKRTPEEKAVARRTSNRGAARPSRSRSRPSTRWWSSAVTAARSGPRCSREAIKRRKPDFSESYYGFRTFGNLLEGSPGARPARFRSRRKVRHLRISRHRRGDPTAATTEPPSDSSHGAGSAEQPASTDTPAAKAEGSRKRRGGRKTSARAEIESAASSAESAVPAQAPETEAPIEVAPSVEPTRQAGDGALAEKNQASAHRRGSRKGCGQTRGPCCARHDLCSACDRRAGRRRHRGHRSQATKIQYPTAAVRARPRPQRTRNDYAHG